MTTLTKVFGNFTFIFETNEADDEMFSRVAFKGIPLHVAEFASEVGSAAEALNDISDLELAHICGCTMKEWAALGQAKMLRNTPTLEVMQDVAGDMLNLVTMLNAVSATKH